MKELQHASLLPADYAKEAFPKKAAKFVLKKAIRFAPASVLIFAGCSVGIGAEKNNTKELESNESGYSLPFPEGETWFLTGGPHEDGYSNDVKYAIDIAPPEGGDCNPFGVRRSIDNRVVTASASGEVIAKGDDKNRNDLHHSEIRIKDKDGFTQVYIHLDKTKVKLGDKVKQGAPLGSPSCEFPPGGRNTGPHVHVGLMKDGQAIPIDGAVVGGWTIYEGVDGKEGTMTKEGEKTRTANVGRYADANGTIRNDLPNTLNKAVVASPKDPIPPISGKATSKEVSPTKWETFKSPESNYQIQYPSSWTHKSAIQYGTHVDAFYGPSNYSDIVVISKTSDPIITLNDHINNRQQDLYYQVADKWDTTPVAWIVTETKIAGLEAQTIQTNIPKSKSYHAESYYITLFLARDPDGLSQLWEIHHRYPTDQISQPDAERNFNHITESFKFIKAPKSTSPAQPEGKISISKTPEELYNALLSTPLKKDLPSGMTVIGTPFSHSWYRSPLDASTSNGRIDIGIDDERSNPKKGQGFPNATLQIYVYDSSQKATDAYNESVTQDEQTRPINNFPYLAVIQGPTYGTYSGSVVIENVFTQFVVTGNDMKVVEQRTIDLMRAMPKLLQNAGN